MKVPSNAAAFAAAFIFRKSFPGHEKDGAKRKRPPRFTRHDRPPSSPRIPSWIARPFVFLVLSLQHHFQLMTTGDTPNLSIEFSAVVALSSLMYLLVAYCYWIARCHVSATLFVLITITSLFSDSIHPTSRFWCSVDRVLTTSAAYVGPIRACLFFTHSLFQSLQIVLLAFFSLVFLAWSRDSKNQSQFVIRHTLWHIASASCLIWLALHFPC